MLLFFLPYLCRDIFLLTQNFLHAEVYQGYRTYEYRSGSKL
jgi:hypothetical protein